MPFSSISPSGYSSKHIPMRLSPTGKHADGSWSSPWRQQHLAELGHSHRTGHEHPPPDHRIDVRQLEPQLKDALAGRLRSLGATPRDYATVIQTSESQGVGPKQMSTVGPNQVDIPTRASPTMVRGC